MLIQNIMKIEPNLGASTVEPSLEAILFAYYAPHMSAIKAGYLTKQYITKLSKLIDGE